MERADRNRPTGSFFWGNPIMVNPRKLTPAVEAEIIAAIGRGCDYRDAALSVGINERTLRRWRDAGGKALQGRLFEFVSALADAEARARARGFPRGCTMA